MKYAILAGSPHQANEWAKENGLNPLQWIYIYDFKDLFGRDVEIIKVGTWYENNRAVNAVEKYLGRKRVVELDTSKTTPPKEEEGVKDLK
jgi:hypothetical protein